MSFTKRSKKVPRNDSKPTSIFHEVAREIAGPEAPEWLAPFLEWLSRGSVYDRMFQKQQPTRSTIRDRLREIIKAVATIPRSIKDPNDMLFLRAVKPNWMTSNPDSALKDLSERAAIASALPARKISNYTTDLRNGGAGHFDDRI